MSRGYTPAFSNFGISAERVQERIDELRDDMKKYKVLRGTENDKVRYEAGEVVTATQLKGFGVKALIAKGAIEEVKNGDREN